MIENRQKTPSGPQGVLLGVPKDPQTTQMAIQDAKMWLPKLTNIKLWCQKGGKPESRRVKDWGPAAEGEALKIITYHISTCILLLLNPYIQSLRAYISKPLLHL